MKTITLPTVSNYEEYLKLSLALDKFQLSGDGSTPATLKCPSSEEIPFPEEVIDILRKVVNALKGGDGVSVTKINAKLTTQQCADMMGVSRPTFIKLAEDRNVKFEYIGRHRRMSLSDFVEFQEALEQEREYHLTQMVRDAQENNLYELTKEYMKIYE